MLLVAVKLCFTGGNTKTFFARRHPKGSKEVFHLVGFGDVASRQSTRNGLLPSTGQLARINGFIHTADVSRLPRLVGILGKSVTLVNPEPLLPRCLPLCSGRRTHQRRIHPKVAN